MFTLKEECYINEIQSRCYLYQHPTGAGLIHIQNQDDNKVFFAAFPTSCENDKGIPHIVEHCVLGGSEKYPVRDPFHEMLKSAFHTYLNAFTYTDKTVYPVASVSHQDFRNLTKVYLDAVFRPLLRRDTFLREGWNFPPSQDGPGGIVYNEMSGVYSDPAEFLEAQGCKALFPNTPYRFDAGGVPEAILSLHYEEFLNFYREKYHPSRCYFYFYGNMDIEEYLTYIHETYLADLPPLVEERVSLFERERSFDRKVIKTIGYPFLSDPREYLYMGKVFGTCHDFMGMQGLRILLYYLLGMQASPFKRAILDAGLGQEVKYGFHGSGLQPVFTAVIHKGSVESNPGGLGELSRLMEIEEKTLGNILREGLDKDMLEACIAKFDFALRDHTGYKPKGLVLGVRVLEGWLHGGNTLAQLFDRMSPLLALEKLRKEGEPYFLSLLQTDLIHNNHAAYLKLVPSYEEKLFSSGKEGRTEENGEFLENKSDSPDELQAIPFIALAERLEKELGIYKAEEIPLEEKSISGMKALFHPMDTKGVVYMDIFFDTGALRPDLVPGIRMLTYVLGKLSTERFDLRGLSHILNRCFGGFSVDFEVYQGALPDYRPQIVIKVKCLSQYLPEVLDGLREILCNTLFPEEELHKLLLELASKMRNQTVNEGHLLAVTRLLSYFSPGGQYKDKACGLDSYSFLRQTISGDKRSNREYLRSVAQAVISRENIVMNITCCQNDYDRYQEDWSRFYEGLPVGQSTGEPFVFEDVCRNEALVTATKVQYVTAAWDLRKIERSGVMTLAVYILSNALLTEEVRLTGGAYGCQGNFLPMGLLYFYSYRDPHLKRTLEVYEKAFSFLRDFHPQERELDKYKIGALNPGLRPKTCEEKGRLSAARYFMQITQEELEKERRELLDAEAEDIRRLGHLMSERAGRYGICVNGSEEAVRKHAGLFGAVKTVETVMSTT